ncbi:hypothetical protein B0F90DRAFT_1665190 [Multifurca ochricompacta]|uniref:Uncharacterized protein n=1 Tax=Multifurca ochricompacta TaxID=376703 RepID=A0AAD4MHD4_9AGAM|nr:hypothetical protein B0F90DRAFT_1665190 [Multifurca ochricompacta]
MRGQGPICRPDINLYDETQPKVGATEAGYRVIERDSSAGKACKAVFRLNHLMADSHLIGTTSCFSRVESVVTHAIVVASSLLFTLKPVSSQQAERIIFQEPFVELAQAHSRVPTMASTRLATGYGFLSVDDEDNVITTLQHHDRIYEIDLVVRKFRYMTNYYSYTPLSRGGSFPLPLLECLVLRKRDQADTGSPFPNAFLDGSARELTASFTPRMSPPLRPRLPLTH